MTDHPSNDQFHSESFLQGHNAAYIEQLYARYTLDTGAVAKAVPRKNTLRTLAKRCLRRLGDVKLLKTTLLVAGLSGLMACVPETPTQSPPVKKISANLSGGEKMAIASGLPADAIILLVQTKKRIAIYLEPKKASAAEIAAAPKNTCSHLRRSVRKVEPLEPSHPGTIENADYLVFHCT